MGRLIPGDNNPSGNAKTSDPTRLKKEDFIWAVKPNEATKTATRIKTFVQFNKQ